MVHPSTSLDFERECGRGRPHDSRTGVRRYKKRRQLRTGLRHGNVGIALGNFGDHKFCREGVWELRIDVGQGYRAYYAVAGTLVVLLLCGGDKRTQDADINQACEYWADWQGRTL
jgi:putative addiction module killer protein